MQPIPKSARKALEIYLDFQSEDWERDYAAKMIGQLEEGRAALPAAARAENADDMLQQRAVECLSYAWRDLGILMSADISGFTPIALQEILCQRGQGPPFRG